MLPIQRKISAHNHYKENTIKYIVVHDVGTRSTAKNNVDYFSGGNRGASAHYFVDDDSIWQSVEDGNGAWHVGDGDGKYGITNTNSIGIEQCLPSGKVTEKTEQNTIELTQYLMKKYNIPIDRVVRHYDASRKNCPAQFNLDGKWTRWYKFKEKLAGKTSTNSTTNNSFNINNYHTTKFVQIKLIKADYAYREKSLTNKSGKILPVGTILTVVSIEYSGKYPRYKLKSGLYITTRKDTVEEFKKGAVASKPVSNLKGSNLASSGYYKVTTATNIRSGASTSASIVGLYNTGEGFNYDSKVVAGGYVWLSYISYSGKRRYVAVV